MTKSQGTSKAGEIQDKLGEFGYESCPICGMNPNNIRSLMSVAVDNAVAQERERIAEEIYRLYPPTFIEEREYGKGVITSGKQEATHIRRLTTDETGVLTNVLSIITNNHE